MTDCLYQIYRETINQQWLDCGRNSGLFRRLDRIRVPRCPICQRSGHTCVQCPYARIQLLHDVIEDSDTDCVPFEEEEPTEIYVPPDVMQRFLSRSRRHMDSPSPLPHSPGRYDTRSNQSHEQREGNHYGRESSRYVTEPRTSLHPRSPQSRRHPTWRTPGRPTHQGSRYLYQGESSRPSCNSFEDNPDRIFQEHHAAHIATTVQRGTQVIVEPSLPVGFRETGG